MNEFQTGDKVIVSDNGCRFFGSEGVITDIDCDYNNKYALIDVTKAVHGGGPGRQELMFLRLYKLKLLELLEPTEEQEEYIGEW